MIRISGEALEAVVNPRRGAKITSLVDAAGTEWLSQGDGREAPSDAAFTDAEMSGWDECAPTIVACRVLDRDVPDHGDLWDAEFDVDGAVVSAVGKSLSYRFERRVLATTTGLRLEYSAEALAQEIPFLWAAHPQFAAPPGTRVELPSAVGTVVDVLDTASPRLPWTSALRTIDTVMTGECRKVYVAPESPIGEARLLRADGSSLTIRWSDACPYLGIWFDNRAFSSVPVIALEPATAYYDSLARAVQLGRAPVLLPGRPFTWWIELDAHPARRPS